MLICSLLLVWLLLLSAEAADARGGCGCGCGNEQGYLNVVTANLTSSYVFPRSPYYLQVTSNQGTAGSVDNVCYTHCPLNKHVSLRFRSSVYINGSYVIRALLDADMPGCAGGFTTAGWQISPGGCCSSNTGRDFILGEPCPGVWVYYTYGIYGPMIDGNNNYCYGVSSARNISNCCADQLEAIARAQGCGGQTFARLPNRLRKRCITRFNGMPCVNANTVPARDSISLPM